MNRQETTSKLTELLQGYITKDSHGYSAREVTFDFETDHSIRVDFMKFKPVNNSVSGIEKGDFYCYEVKSSVEDFRSKNGHNFIGDYNYYVMPAEVYQKVEGEIPYFVGVLSPTVHRWEDLECIRSARRHNRTRPASQMLLMMFRSATRDFERRSKPEEG